jgi:dihydrofolate reductase
MGRLVYSAIASLDGVVNDAAGDFTWAMPSGELHGFVNDLERTVGTYLYGRRLYEIMQVWEDFPGIEDEPAVMQDYAAVWRAADKVVFSTTLPEVTTPRTRLERTFDPVAVRAMVDALDTDVSIGGPTLAAQALSAGIVDEVHMFLLPVVVGGGTSCWPTGWDAGARLDLRLVDEHRFVDGTVHLHHRVARES